MTKTNARYLKDFPNVFEQVQFLSDEEKNRLKTNSKELQSWKCSCGEIFAAKPVNRFRSYKVEPVTCNECTKQKTISLRVANIPSNRRLSSTHPELYTRITRVVSGVTKDKELLTANAKSVVEIKCNCGVLFCSPVSDKTRYSKFNCPSCSKMGKSLFEYEIHSLLEESLGLKIQKHFIKNNTPEVDLYIPDIDFAIQLDPFWSHKDRIDRDILILAQHKKVYDRVLRIRQEPLPSIEDSIPVPNSCKTDSVKWYKEIITSLDINSKSLTDKQIEECLRSANEAWNAKTASYPINSLSDQSYFKDFVKNLSHPGKNPQSTSSGSNDLCLWTCEASHSWNATVGDRTVGNGCLECYRIKRSKIALNKNSLGKKHPEVAKNFIRSMERKTNDPFDILSTSKEKCLWKCEICGLYVIVGVFSKVKNTKNFNRGAHSHQSRTIATKNDLTKLEWEEVTKLKDEQKKTKK